MKAVILAGGKGTRLKPYTTVFPKPLMPVGDRPILEIIIRKLEAHDLKDIIIAIGHLGELIMNFFGDGSKLGVNIKYSKEDEPLGTAGGLGLIKEDLNETFLMINGDTLTTLDFSQFVDYHKRNGAMATVALTKRQSRIDFGLADLDTNDCINKYTEKPVIDHLVSMGVYVLEPEILEYITPHTRLDFPDLIQNLIAEDKKIKGFIFDGYWLDIGRPDDYEKANEEIGNLLKILKI